MVKVTVHAKSDYSKAEPKKTDFGLTPGTAEVMRFSGPTVKGKGKKRKTPGAVNDGSAREAPSSGGAALTAAVKVRADVDHLVLRRTGYQTYEGYFNGKRVKVRRDEVVAHGSFPSNKRQRRESKWFVLVDGQTAGEAESFKEARALAFDACVTRPDGSQSGCKTAGSIAVIDTEGQQGTTYIEQVRVGDRVRALRNVEVDSEDGEVELREGTLGEVQAVSPTAPSVTIFATTYRAKRKEVSVRRRSVTVPADTVALVVSSDDPRV